MSPIRPEPPPGRARRARATRVAPGLLLGLALLAAANAPAGAANGLGPPAESPPPAAPRGAAAAARDELRAVLDEQAAAWTRGDLEAFCAAYAEDAVFVSPGGLTRGRAEVLARYRRRYPDRAAMGSLTLELLEVRVAPGEGAARAASAVARWTLAGSAPATGLTLLVFHRDAGGRWLIVQDASM